MDNQQVNIGGPLQDVIRAQAEPGLAEAILERVFTRIAHVFTRENMETLTKIESQDQTGDAVKYFLLSIVPNFDAILAEEIEVYKQEQGKKG